MGQPHLRIAHLVREGERKRGREGESRKEVKRGGEEGRQRRKKGWRERL